MTTPSLTTESVPGRAGGGLRTEIGFNNPDDVYEILMGAHQGLPDDRAWRVTAKLVLLLANHIGDVEVVREAAALARAEPIQPGSAPSFGETDL